jgi:4-amino-4-deoxy-L-arabinose transferase-like glycosyltransferase
MLTERSSSAWVAGGWALLLVLFAALYVPSQLSRAPWDPDEPRYIEVAREMKVSGDYVLPLLNGEPYGEKPPVFFWLANAAERLTGSFVVGGRLVASLAMVIAALFTFLFAKHFYDARTGLVAAAMFVTFIAIVDYGQRALIDPVFCAFLTITLYLLVRSADAATRRAEVAFGVGAALAMAAGMLTKGPAAVLYPVTGACLIGWARRGRAGIPVAACVGAALFSVAIGLGWLSLAATHASADAGPRYWWRMAFEQTSKRLVDSESHRQPFWHYASELPWNLFPWVLFLPAAIRAAIRTKATDRARFGLFVWFTAMFIVFSAISGKRTGYLFPIYPAFAIVLARRLVELDRGDEAPGRLDTVPIYLAAASVIAIGTAAALFPAVIDRVPALVLPKHQPLVAEFIAALPAHAGLLSLGLGAVMIAIGVAALGTRPAALVRRFVPAICAGIAVGSIAFHAIFVRALDPQKSARLLGEHARRELAGRPSTDRLVLAPQKFAGVYNFYTGALHHDVVRNQAALRAAVEAPGRLWVIAENDFWGKVEPDVKARLEVRGTYRVGRRLMVLLAERETNSAS